MKDCGYYGIPGVRVKFFEVAKEDCDAKELNQFLAMYDVNIIDVKPMIMMYGVTKVMVVYKIN